MEVHATSVLPSSSAFCFSAFALLVLARAHAYVPYLGTPAPALGLEHAVFSKALGKLPHFMNKLPLMDSHLLARSFLDHLS